MTRALAGALALLAALVPAAGARTPAPLRLVFASERTGVSQLYAVGAARGGGVGVVGVDGRGAQRLITSQEESRPAWSPDGRSLLFLHGDSLVVLRGRQELTVATGVSSAAWSPDGRLIAYEKSAELDVVR